MPPSLPVPNIPSSCLSSSVTGVSTKVVTSLEPTQTVSTSNNYDLPSSLRGKTMTVPSLDEVSLESVKQTYFNLSVSAKPFAPVVGSSIIRNLESKNVGNNASLSFYDHRFSDLIGELSYPSFEDHTPPPQEGPNFSFGKSSNFFQTIP